MQHVTKTHARIVRTLCLILVLSVAVVRTNVSRHDPRHGHRSERRGRLRRKGHSQEYEHRTRAFDYHRRRR